MSNFGNYNATYGSLGAVIGFLVWMWSSTIIVLVGAEINAEMGHQTARDFTSDGAKRMGNRGTPWPTKLAKRKHEDRTISADNSMHALPLGDVHASGRIEAARDRAKQSAVTIKADEFERDLLKLVSKAMPGPHRSYLTENRTTSLSAR